MRRAEKPDSEAARQRRITDALTMFGWRWVAYRPAQTAKGWRTPLSGNAGFPDICAVNAERGLLLFIEVKSSKGKTTPEQREWLAALRACHARDGSGPSVWLVDNDVSEQALIHVISGGRIG